MQGRELVPLTDGRTRDWETPRLQLWQRKTMDWCSILIRLSSSYRPASAML